MAVHPLAVTVKDRQIPDWVRTVPNPPHKNLAAMFTKLRWDKTPFVDINDRNPTRLAPGIPSTDPWTCYLDDLAARAEELDQQNCSRSLLDLTIPLQLLDLVPGYMLCLERFPWLRSRVHDLFNFRAYFVVDSLRMSLGKLGSDIDQRRLAYFTIVRPHYPSDQEAMEFIASTPGEVVSVDAVRKSIERALAAAKL